MVPQLCCADTKESATSYQGIRGYISLMIFDIYLFLIEGIF